MGHPPPAPLYIKHFSMDLCKSQEGSEQKWGVRTHQSPRGDATALVKSAMAPSDQKNLFDTLKNLEYLVWPPLCVSTSGQQTFALFEILSTPLFLFVWLYL